jgi:diguanylate cyclase (GGDEF)-like protein
MIDLDRFKLINDSLGHHAGDELLQETARRLTAIARAIDTIGRTGGDEFVMIINPISARDEAAVVAQRVIDALQAPMRIGEVDIHTSPSIGIAVYPADGTNADVLLAHADAAMHCAKASRAAAIRNPIRQKWMRHRTTRCSLRKRPARGARASAIRACTTSRKWT